MPSNYVVSPKIKQWSKHEKKRCESSKMYNRIGGNKRIGGTVCSKLINDESQISAYRQDFFSFSNRRPVCLFGTLE